MNNEPVAWMREDGVIAFHKQKEVDSQGYKWQPLYTHPVKEQYKFGVDWPKDGNAVTVLKICEDGVAEVVFMDYQEATHPAELTDEEIAKVVHELNKKANTPERWVTAMQIGAETIIQLRDELRKAQEK